MRAIPIAVAAFAALAWPWAAFGGTERHASVTVVPAPGEVVVDGRLDDWDMSGSLECFYDEALRPRFTVRVAFMYDARAFYVAARFEDETPLLNRHDPDVEPNLGWAGDCLQVRLTSDPRMPYPVQASNYDRICHLTMWHFTDAKLPVLQAQYGMDYHGTRIWKGPDSGVAFLAEPGGAGYALEARVPWERLNAEANPPKADDVLALVIQPLWSDGTGWKQAVNFNDIVRTAGFSFQDPSMWGKAVLSPHGRLERGAAAGGAPAAERMPLALPLPELDAAAKVLSAAVAGPDGVIVRSLPVMTATGEGGRLPRELRWDGLDDGGRPLPSGKYMLRALTHRGTGQRYVASLHSAGTPPWRTDDGRGAWGGDHGAPIAAASDAERVYLGWEISEAGWAVIAVDPASADHDGPAPKERAQKLWGQHQVLEIGIIVMALATDGERVFVGQDGKRWGQENPKRHTAGVVMWDAKAGRPVNFPFGKRLLVASDWDVEGREGLNLRGVAVAGDRLFVSLHHEDKVLAYDWKTGEKLREIAVEKPGGLEADSRGDVYAVSGRRIVKIAAGTGAVEPVVTAGLSEPYDLALAGGRTYVTDRGDAMQVKVFERGRLVGTIGRAGGRPGVGRYDPQGMFNPAGLTIDRDGRIWVTEYDQTPKRVSVWSREGELLADLLGPGAYAVDASADPQNPRHVNTHCTLFDVDYATGRTRTLATLVRTGPDQMFPYGGLMGRSLFFRHAKGRDYLVARGAHMIIVYRVDDGMVGRLVAATGWLKDAPVQGIEPRHLPDPNTMNDRYKFSFRWADANGDARMQPEEFVVEPPRAPAWGHYWGSYVDEDLTIWSSNREGRAVWRIPVAEWGPGGVPIYPKPSELEPAFTLAGSAGIHYVMPGSAGVYIIESLAGEAGADTRGGKGGAISLVTPEGARRWSFRRVWTEFGLDSPLSQPGDVCGAMRLIGAARLDSGLELVAVNCYPGYFAVLCDKGLWVTSLCKDNRYGPKADETTVWPENFSGFLFRNREDGKVYLIAGDTDARIWEVTGLEHLRTADARFTITPADRALAEEAALRRQGVSAERPPIRLAKAPEAPEVDGRLGDWDMASGVAVDAGGGRSWKAALGFDDRDLYVAFEVADDSAMANAGTDFALLFKTGDSCNVMLAADPKAPADRTRPAKGDVRLLLSVMEGKPVAVLYEPVLRAGERAPRVLSSPTGVVDFDRVAVLERARVAVERTEKGYALEAAVPLADIGFAPGPGLFTKGDAGVIFSDPGGSRNVLRSYYADSDTQIVNDIPSESRLLPQRWGIVRVAE